MFYPQMHLSWLNLYMFPLLNKNKEPLQQLSQLHPLRIPALTDCCTEGTESFLPFAFVLIAVKSRAELAASVLCDYGTQDTQESTNLFTTLADT